MLLLFHVLGSALHPNGGDRPRRDQPSRTRSSCSCRDSSRSTLRSSEAAYDLGAGPFTTFRWVTLPLILPAIVSAFMIAFTTSFDEFAVASFLVGPRETFPVFLYAALRFPSQLPQVIAVAVVVLLAIARRHRPCGAVAPAGRGSARSAPDGRVAERYARRRDPPQRHDPDAGPVAARGFLALDRGRADRRRRRGARDLAAEPRDGRPRRPLCAPRLHRLARPLPHLGAVAGRRRPARLRVARRGARPGTRRAADRELAARPGLARRRLARRPAHAAGARRGRERPPGDADLQGLPRALAQLGRARARGRRPRGRRWCRRPGRVRRADRHPLRGGGLALQGALRPRAGRGVRRGDARGGQGRGRARRHGAARQGRLARRDRPLAAARATGRPAAPRLAVDAGRTASPTCARSACAAEPARHFCGSAT